MTDRKKENLFANLARQQTAKAAQEDAAVGGVAAVEDTPPSPAPADRPKTKPASKKPPEPAKGKRDNPDYCQANAYVPKSLRREVEKAILDVEGLDYSTLVEDLLRKWLKSRGVSE
jgi:hypothetical protein